MKHNFRLPKAISLGLLLAFTALNGCKTELSPEPIEAKQASASNITAFQSHPSMLNTQASLSSKVANTSVGTTEYNQVLSFLSKWDPTGANSTTNAGLSIVETNSPSTTDMQQMRKEAMIAYAYALKWVRLGNSSGTGGGIEARSRAENILNGWATKFQSFQNVGPDTWQYQRQKGLQAAWTAPIFAEAAEILRNYKIGGTTGSGWTTTESSAFATFLVNKLHPNISTYIPASEPGHNTNWGASAAYAKMAIGVYANNLTIYNDGSDQAKARMPYIILNTNTAENISNGHLPEFCDRDDPWHAQYSLTALTYAAEIARNQGDNTIYEHLSQKLRAGYIWTARFFNNYPSALSSTETSCYTGSVDPQTYNTIYPGTDVAQNYYNNTALSNLINSRVIDTRMGSNVPYDFTFLGFTNLTH